MTAEEFEVFLTTWPGVALILALSAWTLAWKGMALWKAAKLGQKNWFVVLLIVNTIGVLEILYLKVFSKRKQSPSDIS